MSHILNAETAGPRKKEKTRTTIVKPSVFKRESSQDMSDPGKLQKLIDESEELYAPPMENFEVLGSDLETLNDWNLDVWGIKTEREKCKLVWTMFYHFNYFEKLDIDQQRFPAFLNIIREKYNHRKNPFHNFDHGFTGLQIINDFLIFFGNFSLFIRVSLNIYENF